MALVRFSKRNASILKSDGQSTIEYLLLLVVVASVALSVFNSDIFQEFLGEDGLFVENYTQRLEFTYRHGLNGSSRDTNVDPGNRGHSSYFNNGQTRFFTNSEPYGN